VSVQFGRWNFDGNCIDADYISSVRALLTPHAPDTMSVFLEDGFCVLYGAFITTNEPEGERQPAVSPSGSYLTWTGRLDNRAELTRSVRGQRTLPNDVEIVSSLYEEARKQALGRLVGDWSLSLFRPKDRKLLLAVDFLGARPLYYLRGNDYILWSSVLEPLVVLARQKFHLSEDYAAGWLSGFSAANLTPYREICSVPPASYIEITDACVAVCKYWEFQPQESRSHTCDGEYQERFRHLFSQAVHRRLRAPGPVLAELSGGMDSSSIVCVADQLLADEPGLCSRLETLSFLNDREPDWNERPFVEAVERRRGRTGYHVDVGSRLEFLPRRDTNFFPSTPAAGILPSLPQQQVQSYLASAEIRVVLSGLGGDETTGGVPDGGAELADLLVQGKFRTFFARALAWCLPTRRPLIYMLGSVLAGFLPPRLSGPGLLRSRVPWISEDLEHMAKTNAAYQKLQLKLHGPRPSFQENLYALEDLRKQIACAAIPFALPRERRYPFLDRDLLEFLYSTPREKIVQPGRRRALMRSALSGIVPEVILERKRKAYVSRNPVLSLQGFAGQLRQWTKRMLAAELGFINLHNFQQALDAAFRGEDSHLWLIGNTLVFESWLRDERISQLVHVPDSSILTISAARMESPSSAIRNRVSPAGQITEKGGRNHEIRKAGDSPRR